MLFYCIFHTIIKEKLKGFPFSIFILEHVLGHLIVAWFMHSVKRFEWKESINETNVIYFGQTNPTLIPCRWFWLSGI